MHEKLDCGDNSCRFAEKKEGMRTNGGCRCFSGCKPEERRYAARLKQRFDRAIECLSYYADVENWVSNSGKVGLCHQIPVLDAELIKEGFAKGQHAAGKKARECLKEISDNE